MKKVVFIVSKELGLEILKIAYDISPSSIAGVITFDDNNDSRSMFDAINAYCKQSGLALEIVDKPSHLRDKLLKFSPDVCMVIGWYWVLKKNVLELAQDGFIGVHASLLPQYRGCAPVVWAMLNGERETGVSLFCFDEGLDEGDIVDQRKISIGKDEYIADVLEKINAVSIEMIRDKYPMIIKGDIVARKQDTKGASYGGVRKPEDGRIDWNNSAVEVYNQIRALGKPYHGAFCFVDGKKVIIYKAKILDKKYFGVPGRVSMITSQGVVIPCGSGAIEIGQVEIKGQNLQASSVMRYALDLRTSQE